jgi:hypothetical protein
MEGCCGKAGFPHAPCTKNSNVGRILYEDIHYILQLCFTAMEYLREGRK